MSYIPPGPYKWTISGLVDSENDLILKPSYPRSINQDKAATLEGFIELLPQYVEDMEDAVKSSRLFLAMITSVLAKGCQAYKGSSVTCRSVGYELCPVCELQAHFDCYQKEQGYLCTPELTGSKIA